MSKMMNIKCFHNQLESNKLQPKKTNTKLKKRGKAKLPSQKTTLLQFFKTTKKLCQDTKLNLMLPSGSIQSQAYLTAPQCFESTLIGKRKPSKLSPLIQESYKKSQKNAFEKTTQVSQMSTIDDTQDASLNTLCRLQLNSGDDDTCGLVKQLGNSSFLEDSRMLLPQSQDQSSTGQKNQPSTLRICNLKTLGKISAQAKIFSRVVLQDEHNGINALKNTADQQHEDASEADANETDSLRMSDDDTFSRESFMLKEMSPFKKVDMGAQQSDSSRRLQRDTSPSETETETSFDLGYLSSEAYTEAKEQFRGLALSFKLMNSRNPTILIQMRAQLIDWIMEVGSEFALRRETVHKAVIYIDVFLQNSQDFPKEKLQLLALAALSLASKIEEIHAPTIKNFAFTANNSFSEKEIIRMEVAVSKSLGWRLNKMTLAKVFNIVSEEWDLYVDSLDGTKCPVAKILKQGLFYLRLRNKKSYHLYCESTQKLDCLICLPLNFKLSPIQAALATIYSVIRRCLSTSLTSSYDKDQQNHYFEMFDLLFSDFLSRNEGLGSFGEVKMAIQAIRDLDNIQFNYGPPIAMQLNSEHVVQNHYEDFLSLQSFNSNISKYLGRFFTPDNGY